MKWELKERRIAAVAFMVVWSFGIAAMALLAILGRSLWYHRNDIYAFVSENPLPTIFLAASVLCVISVVVLNEIDS